MTLHLFDPIQKNTKKRKNLSKQYADLQSPRRCIFILSWQGKGKDGEMHETRIG